MAKHTQQHSQGASRFGESLFRPLKRVGWLAEHADCGAVIWLESRLWQESVTLKWNVFGDRGRRDFVEGSHRLEEEIAARQQDGAKVTTACARHSVLLLGFIHLSYSPAISDISDWTVHKLLFICKLMCRIKACCCLVSSIAALRPFFISDSSASFFIIVPGSQMWIFYTFPWHISDCLLTFLMWK